ncbi:HTH_Tnp_Tc3_2 domain-containing protein [Trichonephila clavipes]|nr:HTH_Tnp_Tc3_2 domain-containing protein [Trichonephila clavipes]
MQAFEEHRRFREGRESVKDDKRPGRPQTFHIAENIKKFLRRYCNNRIVSAQRKHLDDFLRDTIIGRLEWGRTQLEVSEELGIAQSVLSRLWQRFQDDGNGCQMCFTYRNCSLRLTWNREHALWTPQQWSCVMFSDESRFGLQSDSDFNMESARYPLPPREHH